MKPDKNLRISASSERGAVLIVVVGLLLVAGVMASVVVMQQEANILIKPKLQTQQSFENIQNAILAYQRQHHALPCPARLGVGADSANYGVSDTSCGTADSGNVILSDTDGDVHLGAVPTKTLGIAVANANDAWSNRIVYAATILLTDPATFTDGTGTITVASAPSIWSQDAGYVLLSHGQNGAGAYGYKTGVIRDAACASAGADAANCASVLALGTDVEFLKTDYQLTKGAGYYDDQLVFAPADEVAKMQNRPCINLEPVWTDGGANICRGAVIASLAHAATQAVTAISGTGGATLTCNNAKFVYTGVTCSP